MVKETDLVKQGNTLIEASYKLSTLEQKLVRACLAEIKREDKELKLFRFNLSDLTEFLKMEPEENPWQQIKKAARRLRRRDVDIIRTGTDIEIQSGWISSIEFSRNGEWIEIEIPVKLAPFLLELSKKYTSYEIKYVVDFKYSASFRLYELLKSYEGLGKRSFELDELKLKLGVQGKYPVYRDLNRRILTPSIEEINTKSDIQVQKEERRWKNVVKEVVFIIRKKKRGAKGLEASKDIKMNWVDVDIVNRLEKEFGLNKKQAKQIAAHYSKEPDQLETVLDAILYRHSRGQIEDLAAYTFQALKKKIVQQATLLD